MTQLINIYAPIAQAERCLDLWLAEEGRVLHPRLKSRAAALMARYFLHEDDVPDALMLSFLRHYSGFGEVDLDDPACIRQELQSVLDKSAHVAGAEGHRHVSVTKAALCGMIVTTVIFIGWNIMHKKITHDQQTALKNTVERIVAAEGVSHASVWAQAKREYGVARYQDIRWIDYGAVQEALSARLPPD